MQKLLAEKALTLKRVAQTHRGTMAFDVAGAAAAAGVGRDSLYEAIRAGTLEARKLGRRTIITRDALERFIETLPRLELPPTDGQRAA